SALRRGQEPLPERLAAVCFDLTALALAVLVIGGAAALPEWASGRLPLLAPVAKASRRLRSPLVLLPLVGYVASWGMYAVLKQFLDRDAVTFWMDQPIQVFYWAEPSLVLALAAVCLALAWLLTGWLPRWVAGRASPRQHDLIRMTFVFLLVA